ncbi:MAG: bifunctional 23S rRNA (guanine(2069)-N(7))-methyltransferase RlmK/23S rRNA (guanine(2445)-N(2))-methyltransferase RlmL [Planctomycetia bacterium]|nr:bifunctional 23S rRNA (guanine(2069)-N(7))-methyltransferase RlmK/23S rRNA (guanine(2445)-N(2))-methyltransferase RlmL [Planctomycetia bacterium]
MSEKCSLIATSTMGLEAIVSRELKLLGYEPKNIAVGRTLFAGTEKDICRTNMHLRCAGHVLLRMGEFAAHDFGELFDQTVELPWERWLPKDAAFPVQGRSHQSQLSSVPACQKIVKKAIATRLQKAYGTYLPEEGAIFPVEVSLLHDVATLTLDTSGEGLHRRGYKRLIGSAPLRETIAAALILLSYWNPQRPLLDTFCGSGTIPIEAALLGRNIPPGWRRNFISQTWPTLSASFWKEVREEAAAEILPALPRKILAGDCDPEAVKMARYHAELAGVSNDILFTQKDFRQWESEEEYGCTIMNPPYGKWIGEWAEVEEIYLDLPRILRRFPTWSHYLYTGYPHFEKRIGQQADRRRKIYNSRLECTYYQFFGPKPPVSEEPCPEKKPVRAAFGGIAESAERSFHDFENRLKKLAHHLRRFPTRRGITCYRIYDRDIPEIPLAIDRYEDCLHIAEYERPHDRTVAQQADWMERMQEIVANVLTTPREKIFLKQRRRQRGLTQYERYSDEGFYREVQEGGLKFLVNLSDYLDTGLFLDHRNTREMVRRESEGKDVLNLFAYTGSFSVYAADGGAKRVTTVDLSNTYLDWAEENMHRNGFSDPDRYRYIRCDIRKFLRQLHDNESFDLVVVDPPTFSNSKDLEIWDVQKDHVSLLQQIFAHVPSGGVIYFSTNHRKFHLDETGLESVIFREITHQTVPDDFRNKKIHRCWRMVKK